MLLGLPIACVIGKVNKDLGDHYGPPTTHALHFDIVMKNVVDGVMAECYKGSSTRDGDHGNVDTAIVG